MGRAPAAAYSNRMRPYGQPASNFRESTPRPQTVGADRRVHQVMDTSTHVAEPQPSVCAALKKNGEPCKGRPKVGSEYCVFHSG
jgi:hypothetical protein